MRSMLHPVGHLPPGVYWVRRALIVVLVVVLLVVLFRVMGGGPEPSATAGPVTSPTPMPSATLSVPSQSAGPPETVSSSTATSVQPSKSTAPKREDDGRCTAATTRVAILPVARQVPAGRPLNLLVSLSTTRPDGCAAAVDPDRLVLTVTSGKDRIWTSSHCTKAVARATLALAAGKPSTTTVSWDGRRSAARCPANQSVARPGTYVVQATYAGRPSSQQAFQVR